MNICFDLYGLGMKRTPTPLDDKQYYFPEDYEVTLHPKRRLLNLAPQELARYHSLVEKTKMPMNELLSNVVHIVNDSMNYSPGNIANEAGFLGYEKTAQFYASIIPEQDPQRPMHGVCRTSVYMMRRLLTSLHLPDHIGMCKGITERQFDVPGQFGDIRTHAMLIVYNDSHYAVLNGLQPQRTDYLVTPERLVHFGTIRLVKG